MLSEEEKKVINSLENEYKKLEEKGNILFPLYKQQTKILLNIITKLQKENEKYKYLYQKALDSTVSADKENIELKKQIDLMAEYWSAGLAICDECEYIVEAYTKDNCKLCIKQYFEKLAKESRG